MVERTEYLRQLRAWKDEQVIKVITGVRRCGKSTLLESFQHHLREEGIASERIISINFELLENEPLLEYHALYRYVTERLVPGVRNYVFLDEIQMVPEFQKAADSLFVREDVDLYLTGSNAWLLSSELATLLSGRYIEINVLPLSFSEYVQIQPSLSPDSLLGEYMRFGAMPYVALMKDRDAKADTYLEGIYNTIILKDIELRQERKEKDPNKRKINNMTLLRNISRYLAGMIGNPITIVNIVNTLYSSGRSISPATVDDYVEALTEPYLFYPAERFDVIGKQMLKQNKKYYIVDPGFRRYLVPRREEDLGHTLENLVFLELKRRGYEVLIGKNGKAEIDFIARKGEETEYYQVSATLLSTDTLKREITALQIPGDHYQKTILTLDRIGLGNMDGIRIKNVVDWLLTRE